MLVRLLRRHLQPYTGLLLCVLVLQFAQVMASLYLPTLNADIIDEGVATGDTDYIWRTGAFMLAVSVGQGLCTVAATYLAARAAMSMGAFTDNAEATEAINTLRKRANAKTETSYTLDHILDEWSREFAFEGRRRSDLIRFGKFGGNTNYVWQWKGGVKDGTSFGKHLNLYPIPENDLNVNNNLVQHPGY